MSRVHTARHDSHEGKSFAVLSTLTRRAHCESVHFEESLIVVPKLLSR